MSHIDSIHLSGPRSPSVDFGEGGLSEPPQAMIYMRQLAAMRYDIEERIACAAIIEVARCLALIPASEKVCLTIQGGQRDWPAYIEIESAIGSASKTTALSIVFDRQSKKARAIERPWQRRADGSLPHYDDTTPDLMTGSLDWAKTKLGALLALTAITQLLHDAPSWLSKNRLDKEKIAPSGMSPANLARALGWDACAIHIERDELASHARAATVASPGPRL